MEARVSQVAVSCRPLHKPVVYFELVNESAVNQFAELEGKQLDDYMLELKKVKKKSLTANAYMWQLCDKIGKKIGVTKEDVYRESIRQVGIFTDGDFKKDDAEIVQKMWSQKGIGWFSETHGETNNFVAIRFYQGSSEYDGEQMRRLIDHVVLEAQELGIETMTQNEIERLKQLWESKGS